MSYNAARFTQISIHTPARGVTHTEKESVQYVGNFNPHSRKGSDQMHHNIFTALKDFNPHSRKGSDSGKQRKVEMSSPFQSTLPQGE